MKERFSVKVMQASHHLGELANEKTANNLSKDFILLKAVKQTS